MEVKRGNPKAFETLAAKLKELSGIETKVGWFPSATYEDGTPVALVASVQEFGHGPIPPRPFFRPTIAAEENNWKQYAAQGAKAVLKGSLTAFAVMDGLGERAQEDVKETINQITSPPLSPITLELRAMKYKNPALKITGATVGEAAARVRQPGYQLASGTPDKPLIDSKLMITTLTHTTETK
ncbi:hypothetical protein [Fimbriiglobus ruber]|uniref:Phage-related protein n=1 Tax=Fimbriiglobus ruber TaxID=1908690 RepID=A0A225E078_9BACT|nr:hypothetical protein [Fimbriiglobus ruber]OWK42055.1 Phage-related protein [Fimbriiglobus ruber]